ncbi:MAG: hypothetical protein K0S26_223 [Bacteroidota bacterium]|jgi:hypothetical protein|nr:hypothetical protein [Bacteroidota bacterium]
MAVKQDAFIATHLDYNFMDTVYTDVAELCYNKEKSLLHIKILEDVSITVEKAKSLSDSIHKITNGEKHFTLVDATNYFFIEDEALKYMALPESGADKMGSAYFSTNLANRLTMHFFKVFHKPSYPVQLFRKEEEAMSWLKLIQKTSLQLN